MLILINRFAYTNRFSVFESNDKKYLFLTIIAIIHATTQTLIRFLHKKHRCSRRTIREANSILLQRIRLIVSNDSKLVLEHTIYRLDTRHLVINQIDDVFYLIMRVEIIEKSFRKYLREILYRSKYLFLLWLKNFAFRNFAFLVLR